MPNGEEEQPQLPAWMSYTTFRDAQGRPTSTGIVQGPLVYSGPSIPLGWPWIAASDLATASYIPVSLLGGQALSIPITASISSSSSSSSSSSTTRPVIFAAAAAAATPASGQPAGAPLGAGVVAGQAVGQGAAAGAGSGGAADGAQGVGAGGTSGVAGSAAGNGANAGAGAGGSGDGEAGAIGVGGLRPTSIVSTLPGGRLTTFPAVISTLLGGSETIIVVTATTNAGLPLRPTSSAILSTLPNGSVTTLPRPGSTLLTTPDLSTDANRAGALSAGQIAGIVLGALAGLALLFILLCCLVFGRRRRSLDRERRSIFGRSSWRQMREYRDEPEMVETAVAYRDRPEDEGVERTGSSGQTAGGFSQGGQTSGSDSPSAAAPLLMGAAALPRHSQSTYDPKDSPEFREEQLFYSMPASAPSGGRPHSVIGSMLPYNRRESMAPSEFGQRGPPPSLQSSPLLASSSSDPTPTKMTAFTDGTASTPATEEGTSGEATPLGAGKVIAGRVFSGLGLGHLFAGGAPAEPEETTALPRATSSNTLDRKAFRPATATAVGGIGLEDSPTLGYVQPSARGSLDDPKEPRSDDEEGSESSEADDDERAAFLAKTSPTRPRWSHATLGQRVQHSNASPARSFAASIRSVSHTGLSPSQSPVNSRSSRRTASEGLGSPSHRSGSRSSRQQNSNNGSHSQSASSGSHASRSRRYLSRSEEVPLPLYAVPVIERREH